MEHIEHFTKGSAILSGYLGLYGTSSRLNVNPRKCIIRRDNLMALRSTHRRTPWRPKRIPCKGNRSRGALTMGVFPFVNLTGLLRAYMESWSGESVSEETRVLYPDRCDRESLHNSALASGGVGKKLRRNMNYRRINDIICRDHFEALCLLDGWCPRWQWAQEEIVVK